MKLRYDLLLDPLVIICTLLLIAIPLSIRYINQYLHAYGDPPWKKDSEEQEKK